MPKIVDHNLYRQELLSKCFDLFASRGYGSVTMREIAQGIGVSTGTLYHYFSGKEAIFLQLVEEQTKEDISNFLAEADKNQPVSGRIETLFKFIAKNEDYFHKQMLIWVDFCRQQDNKDLLKHEKLKQADEELRQVLTDYLQISEPLVELIFSLIYGIVMARLFEGKTLSYVNQGNLLAKMVTIYLESESGNLIKSCF